MQHTYRILLVGTLCLFVFFTSLTLLYRQLLHDCGIGLEVGEEEVTSAVGQHRALLFCQYKSMLDIIERDLFK